MKVLFITMPSISNNTKIDRQNLAKHFPGIFFQEQNIFFKKKNKTQNKAKHFIQAFQGFLET